MKLTGNQIVVLEYGRLCRWLSLPTGDWPPDHYTLLGLEKGESNSSRLEASVQSRLRLVRGYQLSHPELATEAMNRLAEAFACLSDPVAKQCYDAERGFATCSLPSGTGTPGSTTAPKQKVSDDTITGGLPTVVAWDGSGSPPIRPPESGKFPTPVPGQKAAEPPLLSKEVTPKVAPTQEPVDPILVAAQKSWRAWKGLWSQSVLQERTGNTQALLKGWMYLGRFVGGSKRPLPAKQQKDFVKSLERLERLLEKLPSLLGEPGQTGYRIAILARDEDPVHAFQKLGQSERQLLAQDWKVGGALLRAHLDFLEVELSELNRVGFLNRWFRPVLAVMTKQPVLCFLSLMIFLGLICVLAFSLR